MFGEHLGKGRYGALFQLATSQSPFQKPSNEQKGTGYRSEQCEQLAAEGLVIAYRTLLSCGGSFSLADINISSSYSMSRTHFCIFDISVFF